MSRKIVIYYQMVNMQKYIKEKLNSRRTHKAFFTEQRKNIKLQLDALDIDPTSEHEYQDPQSLEMCRPAHEVIDFWGNKEFSGVAEEMYPDYSNVEHCLVTDQINSITRLINYDGDDAWIESMKHLGRELEILELDLLMSNTQVKHIKEPSKEHKKECAKISELTLYLKFRYHYKHQFTSKNLCKLKPHTQHLALNVIRTLKVKYQ